MDIVTLKAVCRKEFGTGPSRRMRREGSVPANLYGHGIKPVSLRIDKREFKRVLNTKAGENVVIDLNVEDAKLEESTCRIKAIQHNPVSEEIEHVDFTLISLTEKITVMVPVVAVGGEESPGVKEGGVLDVIHHEIEVECLPTQIPEKIEVDAKALNIGDIIHVKDLKFPEGVATTLEEDEAVVTVHPPAAEEEPAAEEGAQEPEVMEKGKKPVEGEEEGKPAEGQAKSKEGQAKAKDAQPKAKGGE